MNYGSNLEIKAIWYLVLRQYLWKIFRPGKCPLQAKNFEDLSTQNFQEAIW